MSRRAVCSGVSRGAVGAMRPDASDPPHVPCRAGGGGDMRRTTKERPWQRCHPRLPHRQGGIPRGEGADTHCSSVAII